MARVTRKALRQSKTALYLEPPSWPSLALPAGHDNSWLLVQPGWLHVHPTRELIQGDSWAVDTSPSKYSFWGFLQEQYLSPSLHVGLGGSDSIVQFPGAPYQNKTDWWGVEMEPKTGPKEPSLGRAVLEALGKKCCLPQCSIAWGPTMTGQQRAAQLWTVGDSPL